MNKLIKIAKRIGELNPQEDFLDALMVAQLAGEYQDVADELIENGEATFEECQAIARKYAPNTAK